MLNKKQLEELLGKKLAWHEYTDKGTLVAGGTFENADPLLISELWNDNRYMFHVKCAGTKKFRPIADYCDGKTCRACVERKTLVLESSAAGLAETIDIDITSPQNAKSAYGISSIIVPHGCPHATEKIPSGNNGMEDKRYANSVVLTDSSRSPILHSWKIVETPNKLTLSIQYRLRFIDVASNKFSDSSMYCHIMVDTKNGRTYISNIHSGNRKLKTGMFTNPIETLTFTGSSELVSYMKEHDSFNEPLRILRDRLVDKLAEQGYDVAAFSRPLSSFSWNEKTTDWHPITTNDLLWDISIKNRFPSLGVFPLPPQLREFAALYLRRRFDKLPRDITASKLAEALGIEVDDETRKNIEKKPSNVFYLALLDEWGLSPEKADAYYKTSSSAFESNIGQFVHNQNKNAKTFDLFDLLSIVYPFKIYYEKEDRTGRNRYMGDVLESLLSLSGNSIRDLFMAAAKKNIHSVQKFKEKWDLQAEDLSVRLYHINNGIVLSGHIVSKHKVLGRAELSGRMYIDRRVWTKKIARRYAKWVEQYAPLFEFPQDVPPALLEEGRALSELLARSIRFDYTLFYYSVNNARIAMLSQQQPQHSVEEIEWECRVVYEWATKNDITVPLSVDNIFYYDKTGVNVGKKVRSSIEARTKRKKK